MYGDIRAEDDEGTAAGAINERERGGEKRREDREGKEETRGGMGIWTRQRPRTRQGTGGKGGRVVEVNVFGARKDESQLTGRSLACDIAKAQTRQIRQQRTRRVS